AGAATVNIETGTTLDIQDGSVVLDGDSDLSKVTWNGTVELNGGSLTLKNIKDGSAVVGGEAYNKTGILNAFDGELSIDNSTVLLGNQDVIAKAVELTLTGDLKVTDNGTDKTKANVYIDGDTDNWTSGNIEQTGGRLTLDDISTDDSTSLNSNGGALTVIGTTTLDNENDTIGAATTVTIGAGDTLAIEKTSATGVTINADDTWNGTVTQSGDDSNVLNISGTTIATDTTRKYKMSGANSTLNIRSGGSLSLNTSDSTTTEGTINILGGSSLTYDNSSVNDAVIRTDSNASNSLTVGNGTSSTSTELTLNSGSNINANTSLNVNKSGILNSVGTSIKGAVSNNGTYNLENDGATAGTIAGALTGSGDLNLTGTTMSTSAGTINQANMTVDDGTFTMDANATITNNLAVSDDGNIVNNGYNTISTATIDNDGSITGSNGSIAVSTGGDNSGTITQANVTLAGTLHNSGDITATRRFTNTSDIDGNGTLTMTAASSGNTNSGNVTQKDVTVGGTLQNTGSIKSTNTFTNTAAITDSTPTRTGSIEVKNASIGAAVTQKALTVNGNVVSNADIDVHSLQLTESVAAILNNANKITAGTIDNKGSITGDNGTVNIGGGTTSGTISQKDVNITGDLLNTGDITSTGDFANTAAITGDTGTIEVNNATFGAGITQKQLTINGTTIHSADKIDVNTLELTDAVASILNVNGTVIEADNIDNKGNIAGGGDIYMKDGTNSGTISQAGVSIADNGHITSTGDITADESFVVGTNATLDGTGNLNISDTVTSAANNGSITQDTVSLNADFENTSDSTSLTTNTLVINSGVELVNEGITTVKTNLSNTASTITNNNELVLGDEANVGGAMSNNGTIRGSGDLMIYSNLTNDGAITQNDIIIAQDATLNTSVSDDELDVTGGTIHNDGTLNITAGTELDTNIDNASDGGFGTINLAQPNDMDINAKIANNELIQNDYTLRFASAPSNIKDANLTINGGMIDLQNGRSQNLSMQKLSLGGDSSMLMDANLYKETMDAINIISKDDDAFTNPSGGIITINTNMPSNTGKKVLTNPEINLSPIAKGVTGTIREELAASLDVKLPKKIVTPIFIYEPKYDSRDGSIKVHATGGTGGYNNAVVAAPVAQQSVYFNQLTNYAQAFNTMDNLMALPSEERMAMLNRNKIASEGGLITYDPNVLPEESGGVWFNPYAAYDKVNLKNGPKVKDFSYGGLVGLDIAMKQYKNGWNGIYNVYAGFNGNHLKYTDVSENLAGGVLGVTGTWYKKNFFTGLTVNAGASQADAHTMYGSEDFTMLTAGVASKTGYNWELLNGKMLIQPSWSMAYTFVNTFSYKNAAGVRIKSDPLNAITLQPAIRLIGKTRKGWQPYADVSMIWNIMDRTHFTAQDVSLPRMSTKPYVQYGVGLKRSWGERFTGWGQIVVRNGGRNGIAAQLGFKLMLGNAPVKIQRDKINPQTEIKNQSDILTPADIVPVQTETLPTIQEHPQKSETKVIKDEIKTENPIQQNVEQKTEPKTDEIKLETKPSLDKQSAHPQTTIKLASYNI
ncbi:MAG: hypothetical protein K6A44_06960, partial [bacterium]|nr:hypothetical protein [bacterium]